MYDAPGLYPKGFHPMGVNLDTNGKRAYPLHRGDVPLVRYYFTDFGISTRFEDDEPRKVLGTDGLDQDAPELSEARLYDPFPLDIFILGNVFKNYFTKVCKETCRKRRYSLVLQEYKNMEFLNSLVEDMTRRKPSERPSAADALARYEAMVSALPGYARRWRLKPVEAGSLRSFIHYVGSLRRECVFVIRSVFNMCTAAI